MGQTRGRCLGRGRASGAVMTDFTPLPTCEGGDTSRVAGPPYPQPRFVLSATCSQPRSDDIKWKIPEVVREFEMARRSEDRDEVSSRPAPCPPGRAPPTQ